MSEDDAYPTESSLDQLACEQQCQLFLHQSSPTIPLLRDAHVRYVRRALEHLPSSFRSLDASRPWICYWILHSLAVLGQRAHLCDMSPRVVETLRRCQNPITGGFCGNVYVRGRLSHAATTYASCLALASVASTAETLASVDRVALHRFFTSLKDEASGGFAAHVGGEVDVRVSYCVVATASLYQIWTPALSAGVVDYALACQTYEGGFGGEPGNEAHGGYTFCAVALLSMCHALDRVDAPALCHWIAHRQMACEGGYQGRTNKLVDGCYSYWQGSVPVIMAETFHAQGLPNICDRRALQDYILSCCQQVEGGLRDKPSKPRDYYHTCYCLSGLSIAQYGVQIEGQYADPVQVFGDQKINPLVPTHPIYNITREKVDFIQEYFRSQPPFDASSSSCTT